MVGEEVKAAKGGIEFQVFELDMTRVGIQDLKHPPSPCDLIYYGSDLAGMYLLLHPTSSLSGLHLSCPESPGFQLHNSGILTKPHF